MRCIGCGDEVYEGEAFPEDPDFHTWCVYMAVALRACTDAMMARRAKGLPTPTSPLWTNPGARGN